MPAWWQPHIREYGVPICASSLMITMSAQSAISLPPPTAQPCTCAITGFGVRHRLMNLGTQPLVGEVVAMNSLPGSHFPSVVRVSSQKWKPPPKLKPPQNERPAPRSTMTLTARSSVASWTAASSSSVIGGTIVFSASGRFSVIEAMAPVDVVEQGLVLAHVSPFPCAATSCRATRARCGAAASPSAR